ncbi:hypothetical protein [Pontibacter arcticus]|uniref:Uncharacterized protein n=1 Tax=Pontibacter arcticus TaxID=2080288 RepID=A0A364RHG7_9BACT|nr:hypothetical protein [Pontibacter arcticus]RAU83741.1 hypothetical protein DP923_01345 [Pontibacter arcticus]
MIPTNKLVLNTSFANCYPGYHTLSAMKKSFSLTQSIKVDYFFMPERQGKPAEIIMIINNPSRFILVPTREEDIELESFYQRNATEPELTAGSKTPVWKVFFSWQELEEDHQQAGVSETMLHALSNYTRHLDIRREVEAY